MFTSGRSLYTLKHKAEDALCRGNINGALCLIHDFVECIVTEPLCVAQVFASRDLDDLCLRIGQQNLVGLTPQINTNLSNGGNESTVIYLVSRLQRSGGHARLILDFIRAQPERQHLILSTEIGGPSDKDYYSKIFSSATNVRLLLSPGGDFASRLTWVQSFLHVTRADHVYLFNHHQDSVAVSAVVPELVLRGSFCHHGDHHLCLGVHLSHLAHIDLHPMGFHHCRQKLGVANQYVPLTCVDKNYLFVQTEFLLGGPLTTATAARFNKVEIPYYVSYLDVIPQVLKLTGGKHIHIGKLMPWALRRIYKQLRIHGVKKDRFVYIDWVPSVWQTLQEHKADVYLASFPYGAGLTLIEAMGAGLPVILHEHMYSRVLSGLEIAYPEAFRWAYPEDLLNYLACLTPEKIRSEKKISRLHYEKNHRFEILMAYLQDPNSWNIPVPPLVKSFKPRYDEWAVWAESQLNFSRLLFRVLYRMWRSFRRRLV